MLGKITGSITKHALSPVLEKGLLSTLDSLEQHPEDCQHLVFYFTALYRCPKAKVLGLIQHAMLKMYTLFTNGDSDDSLRERLLLLLSQIFKYYVNQTGAPFDRLEFFGPSLQQWAGVLNSVLSSPMTKLKTGKVYAMRTLIIIFRELKNISLSIAPVVLLAAMKLLTTASSCYLKEAASTPKTTQAIESDDFEDFDEFNADGDLTQLLLCYLCEFVLFVPELGLVTELLAAHLPNLLSSLCIFALIPPNYELPWLHENSFFMENQPDTIRGCPRGYALESLSFMIEKFESQSLAILYDCAMAFLAKDVQAEATRLKVDKAVS